MVIANLQSLNKPQNLGDRATNAHRIPDDGADNPVGIDDKVAARTRRAVQRAWTHHPIGPGDRRH